MSKRGAGLFVFVAFFALGGIDIYLALDSSKGNTYSEVIREWSYSMRWLPYAIAAMFGALLSHWFAKPYKPDPEVPGASVERPLKQRLIVAGSLLLTLVVAMGVGFFW